MLERFGEPVDPPTLNNFFIAHGSYLVDGPNRDNLGWGSVSAYDGNVVATQIGGAGWPSHNEAIVKFVYKSLRSGNIIPHFCLVIDHSAGTILDSYDGHVKHTPYGNPVAWATYAKHTPQVVPPPPPAEHPAFSVEDIASKTMQFKKNTHLWDLNQRSWPSMVNNPANSVNGGDTFQTSHIAHQILGGSYYMPDGDNSHGYNVVDCQDYVAPVPPVPVTPPSPPAGPVRPGGNPDNKYTLIKTVPGYTTATNAGNHTSQANEVVAGDYFVYNTHPNNADLVNVTSKLGSPGSWINKADNVPDTPPPPPPAPEPVPPEPHVATPPVDSTTPINWQETYRPFPAPVHYISTRAQVVYDLALQQPDMPLPKYNNTDGQEVGVVSAYGTVTKDGVDYYRLKTNNDPDFKYWYSIPKVDPNTRTPNLLVKPTSGNPIGKATVARDTIQLAKSHLETDLSKFLDDMFPNFLRHKNKK